jgi:hypothetical protein
MMVGDVAALDTARVFATAAVAGTALASLAARLDADTVGLAVVAVDIVAALVVKAENVALSAGGEVVQALLVLERHFQYWQYLPRLRCSAI